MTYYILVENGQKSAYKATVLGLPDCVANGRTRQEALQTIRRILSRRLAQAEIVPIELEETSPAIEHPWLKFAGVFKDNALFDEMQAEIAAYRYELDADSAIL